jgi:hypothetical protein
MNEAKPERRLKDLPSMGCDCILRKKGLYEKYRYRIARILFIKSAATLIVSFLVLGVLMVYAKLNDYLPDGEWGVWPGNHGPWHFNFLGLCKVMYTLKKSLLCVFDCQLFAIVLALLAFGLRPRRLYGFNLFFIFFSFMLTVYYFYWLID